MFLFKKRKNNDQIIRFSDNGRGLLLYRYGSDPGDLILFPNMLIRAEKGQYIVFMNGKQMADVWDPGDYPLTPLMFPILEEQHCFPLRENQPVSAQLYFVSTDPVTERKWATKTPALVQEGGNTYRVRAYGTYDFQVTDPIGFMLEAFMNRGLENTFEVMGALSTFVAGAFTATVSEMQIPVVELINHPREISELVRQKANRAAQPLGIRFLNILIEGTSLPD